MVPKEKSPCATLPVTVGFLGKRPRNLASSTGAIHPNPAVASVASGSPSTSSGSYPPQTQPPGARRDDWLLNAVRNREMDTPTEPPSRRRARRRRPGQGEGQARTNGRASGGERGRPYGKT